MRLLRLATLALMAFLAVALLSWDLDGPRPRKTMVPARNEPDLNRETGMILQGTLVPMITIPIAVRDLKLMVPLNTQVQQGEVIGVAPVQVTPADVEHTQSELADANYSIAQAEERLREINEELNARRAQASSMSTHEIAAERGELEAEEELARRGTLFRSGLTSERDYNTAAMARASSDAALTSLRSNMALTEVEIDGWEARAAEAQTNLADATKRRNAAALGAPAKRADDFAPVVAPADGMIVVSEDPAGTSVGIASDPGQLCVYAPLKQADLASVRIGQQALIVLDSEPAVTLQARVAALSANPDLPEGARYMVALSVENPGRTWMSHVAVHVLIERPSR